MSRIWIAIVALLGSTVHADDLILPETYEGGPVKQMMSRHLKRVALEKLDQRRRVVEALKTEQEIAAYQEKLRGVFQKQLGGFPEKTPLNGRVVARLAGDGCRIEKILFESRPGHFVAADLYLPPTKSQVPAVLLPCGHAPAGKAASQRLGVFFAQNGLAAFAYDPIGQGERYQLLDVGGKPRFQSTNEHTLIGISSMLVGQNTATYRIWDGIRALDYLETRDDILKGKFGCTGISGGGTLTEYLMALDTRIFVAAPGCAPTTFARRLETIGPGDAEQNIYAQIALGLDHADYSILRAPRPTLILAASEDFVDIRGTWDLYREASRVYAKLGHSERMAIIEADAKHGFSEPLRIAAVRWMRRWLLGKDDAVIEPKNLKLLPADDLLCTPKGQVQLLPDARSVLDINADLAKSWEGERKKLWENQPRALASVRELANIRPLKDLPRPNVRVLGKLDKDGVEIQKILLEPEADVWLPGLLHRPKTVKGPAVLYVHGDGKSASAAAIDQLVKNGSVVFAIDLRGMGETGPKPSKQWGGNFYDIFTAYLLGRPLVGQRAEDVLTAARYLSELNTPPKSVRMIAVDLAGPPALHAAALERSLFEKVELENAPTSWLPVLRDPTTPGHLVNAVHGALRFYDLKDLWAVVEKGQ